MTPPPLQGTEVGASTLLRRGLRSCRCWRPMQGGCDVFPTLFTLFPTLFTLLPTLLTLLPTLFTLTKCALPSGCDVFPTPFTSLPPQRMRVRGPCSQEYGSSRLVCFCLR